MKCWRLTSAFRPTNHKATRLRKPKTNILLQVTFPTGLVTSSMIWGMNPLIDIYYFTSLSDPGL